MCRRVRADFLTDEGHGSKPSVTRGEGWDRRGVRQPPGGRLLGFLAMARSFGRDVATIERRPGGVVPFPGLCPEGCHLLLGRQSLVPPPDRDSGHRSVRLDLEKGVFTDFLCKSDRSIEESFKMGPKAPLFCKKQNICISYAFSLSYSATGHCVR